MFIMQIDMSKCICKCNANY